MSFTPVPPPPPTSAVPPYPYGEPRTYFMNPADAAAGASIPGAVGALAVEAFDIPDRLPDANMLLGTGRWEILHVTDTMLLIKRIAHDPPPPVNDDGVVIDPDAPPAFVDPNAVIEETPAEPPSSDDDGEGVA